MRRPALLAAVLVAVVAGAVGFSIGGAAVSRVDVLWTCVRDSDGVATGGWTAYQRPCTGGQPFSVARSSAPTPTAATTTTRAATTTTSAGTTTTAPRAAITAATGSFAFRDLTVWYAAPANPATARILVVMHGQSRTGRSYRDAWASRARTAGVLLIVPEFSTGAYPGEAYTLGPRSFTQIEPLFDYVRADVANPAASYLLYGHSAGAQFVHRFLLLTPTHRAQRAVAANAGWYTAPEDVAWPYGLRNAATTDAGIRRWLATPMTVMLGENDTQRDSDLRTTTEADRQGPHRLARGNFFYRTGVDYAAVRSLPFGWSIHVVPGAEHSNADMVPAAAEILFR